MKHVMMIVALGMTAGVSALAVDGTWTASGVANANWNDPGGMSVEGTSIPQGSVEAPLGGDVTFGGLTFYPGETLVFAGGDAVLTNQHGFCEFSGPSVGNWAGNLAQPLTFNGWKPTAERVAEPTSATFPLNTQYSYRGMWHVPADNFYSFAGTFDDGIYLTIDGQVILNVHTFNARSVANGVYLTQGWHDIELRCSNGGGNGGKTAGWPSGIIYSPDDLDFSGNENLEFGHVFGDDGDVIAALDGINYIFGRMLMNEDGTLTISPNLLGEPVFSGIVQSPANKTLTFSGLSGDLPFGSPESLYPAVLDGDIVNALILTNHAWLCRIPSPFTVADGATLAFDGITPPDAAAGALTLGTYSLQMLDTTLGVDAVTVNTDRTLSFKSRYYDDGGFIEKPSAYSTDITLNGGTVAFDNTQPIFFDGAFSGSGAILKNGAGDLTLAGAGSGCAAALHLYEGSVTLSNATALCDAPVYLAGGILRNLENLTLNPPVSTWLGGFETPATTVFEIESQITGYGNVSKWGAGTLRLSGYDDNTDFQLHVRGGTVELDKSDGYAVGDITGIESGTTVILTGSSGNQIADDGYVQLSGGTLDLNGYDETVGAIQSTVAGGTILNNGNRPTTLTVGGGDASSTYGGVICDGAEPIALTKIGTGTVTLSAEAFKYTGATTVNGGTLHLLGDDYRKASLVRLTFTAARPIPPETPPGQPDYYGSGIQISEFQLTYNGVGVNWPPLSEMEVYGNGPTGGEGVQSAVDNNTGTKWYFNESYSLPNALTIALAQPIFFNGYRIATANDAIGRDPSGWTFEIGVVDGTTTNWNVLDTQPEYDMPLDRRTYIPALPLPLMANDVIPASMPVVVNAVGTLMLSGFSVGQVIEGLTGSGTLMLANSTVILPHPEAFTGTITGNGTVIFSGTTNTITVQVPGDGITLINNGEPATLLNTITGMWGANIQDGTAPLGLTQTAGTTYYTATDSTYTGDTLLSGGEAIVARVLPAQYVRFTPLGMKPEGLHYTWPQYQVSRFRLMQAGQEITYPAGTTAYGEVWNTTGDENASNVILPDDPVGNSKFYSSSGNINPLIIDLPYAILIDGYTWYTAHDAEGRDPITWTVEVSTDKVTWTLVDSREYEDVTDDRNTKAGEWHFGILPDVFCAFSPNSLTTIEAAAKLSIVGVTEPVGPLFGDGTIALDDGTLLLNTFTDATFDGTVEGAGVLVKQGEAVQTFTGALGFSGDLIVEDGILNLDSATLTGVTNIILRGGILTGTATVSGNLTVTFEGGIYDATLNVSGTLSVDGEVLLWLPEGAPLPHKRTLFTYGSADAGTLSALRDALMATPLDPGIIVSIKTDGGTVSLTISRGGTILMIR
ncbi:MAG: autotransporter-associated beta strand repeat-containing protein [Kiritimatiellaeota bacterium]|nr:autotransporter-associated beta strand repeat-containing protein [Kiritimatiellota bacterium]